MKKRLSVLICLALVLGCFTGALGQGPYTPGTYTGVGYGLGGKLTVQVSFDENALLSAEVITHNETPAISDRAIAELPERIVAAQSTEVDGVSGATMTSIGIREAVENAIAQARGEAEAPAEEAAAAQAEAPVYDAAAEQNEYAKTIEWAAQYDVVVAGYGAAGATAAIAAADEGARVLLTEKAPKGHEGGNTKYAGQDVMGPDDRDKFVSYYKSLRGLYTNLSDSMIEKYADVCMENPAYLISLGAKEDEFWIKSWPEFPEFEGSDAIYTWIVGGMSFQGTLYYLLQDNVSARSDKIDVWYESPAVHLIQDPASKIVLGVQIEKGGETVNVRAKNGVVLATGGFEANPEMIQNYLQRPYVYVRAAVYNTGDGIRMAQELGADLWHMGNTAGFSWAFQPYDEEMCLSLTMTGGIIVGPEGTRFMNELAQSRHGKINYGGTWIAMPTPLPAYFVFDENARLNTTIVRTWSEGCAAEIEKGYVIKADTVEELAGKIGVPVENLASTIAAYNGYCEAGEDAAYGRDPEKMSPVGQAPFYAMEIGPTMLNTHGGPKRNEEAEVLDVNGEAIPHLYSAGEMGALFSDMYNGGGNLGECIGFGRIAGRNAAAEK